MYASGEGVPEDLDEACRWFTLAAEQGDPHGELNLKNLCRGRSFSEREKKGGDKEERIRLIPYKGGDLMSGTKDGGKSFSKSGLVAKSRMIEAYFKKAEKGDMEAQMRLGQLFEMGDGVPQDNAMAIKWYQLAANQGDTAAMNNLAHMYKNGQGVAKDDAEAAKWYRKASDQGEPVAQYSLGFMHLLGEGAAKDKAEGVRLLRESARQGFAPAQDALKDMGESW